MENRPVRADKGTGELEPEETGGGRLFGPVRRRAISSTAASDWGQEPAVRPAANAAAISAVQPARSAAAPSAAGRGRAAPTASAAAAGRAVPRGKASVARPALTCRATRST